MIIAHHKPETIEAALYLLTNGKTPALAFGGGTVLTIPNEIPIVAVDLQKLSLSAIVTHGRQLRVGAMLTLQAFLDSGGYQAAIREAVALGSPLHLRTLSTIGGALVASDGCSPLAVVFMAVEVQVHVLPENRERDLSELLHLRATNLGLPALPGRLITEVVVNTEVDLAYFFHARSPADPHIISVAAARWPSGRLRIVVGGWGRTPRLAFDAQESEGWLDAVHSAAAGAEDPGEDSGQRQDIVKGLATKAVEQVLV